MRFKPSHLLKILGLSAMVIVGTNLTVNRDYGSNTTKSIENAQLILYGASAIVLGYYLKRKMPESDNWSR